jgi:hypothetical protein
VEAGPPDNQPDEAPPGEPSQFDPSAWPPPAASGLPVWPPPGAWAAPGTWPAPVGGPTRKRRVGVWVGAGAAALVLIVGVVVVATGALAKGPSYPKAWDPRVAPIAQFVEKQRGLHWKHPVKVEFLADKQFVAAISQGDDSSGSPDDQSYVGAVRAFGLISGNVDLSKSSQDFQQTDVVGLYENNDRTVFVRGDTLNPNVRSVLAHELTHALQAQYFNLDKMRSGHQDDDSAVTALIEGDAVRVQNAYEQSLSSSDQQLLIQEQDQTGGQIDKSNSEQKIPQFLIDQGDFPYDFGPTFVAALVAEGGNDKVNAAFRDPPTLDSQIITPGSYAPGGRPPSVRAPVLPRGAHEIQSPSGFGQLPLTEMLGDEIGYPAAWSATRNWQQDQWIGYTVDGRSCVDLTVLSNSSGSAAGLLQAGEKWASHLPGARVTRSGAIVDFHSCDPGSAWKPAQSGDDTYTALATQSVLTYQLITDAHLSVPLATCTSDRLLTSVGLKELEAGEQATDPNSPAVQALQKQLPAAVQACSQTP